MPAVIRSFLQGAKNWKTYVEDDMERPMEDGSLGGFR
jgi:hypothetical protein